MENGEDMFAVWRDRSSFLGCFACAFPFSGQMELYLGLVVRLRRCSWYIVVWRDGVVVFVELMLLKLQAHDVDDAELGPRDSKASIVGA